MSVFNIFTIFAIDGLFFVLPSVPILPLYRPCRDTILPPVPIFALMGLALPPPFFSLCRFSALPLFTNFPLKGDWRYYHFFAIRADLLPCLL